MADLNGRALAARTDETELAALMREYRPFVLSEVIQRTGGAREDAVHAGLTAFAEAVLAYSPDKGAFLPFARTVLSRRLIDYGRREARWHRGHVSLEEEAGQAAVNAASVQAYEMKLEQEARREEIARLSAALAKYSIGFSDLASAAPKQEGTREQCMRAVGAMMQNPAWREGALRGRLPISEAALSLGISRKLLERHRRYLVAAVLISSGDYPYLQQYIRRDAGKEAKA